MRALLAFVLVPFLIAADWPMNRFDARRSAASPQILPADLHLQWTMELPPLKPAWPDQPKMPFDHAYEPIILGHRLIFGSSRNDTVCALDTRTGNFLWRFFADAPVRFAPVGYDGKVYLVSDDGYLYCLDADTGKSLWKFRGGPSDRQILGNERLISTWPARGAPVISSDGTLYFASGIWPFMGIFIHALEAKTGKIVWTNDGDGSIFIKQPHNTDAFASVAPQGAMVLNGDYLLIPGGRSVPACFDRKTGKLLRFQLAENGKRGGGSQVSSIGNLFFNGGDVFDLKTENCLGAFPDPVVLTDDVLYGYSGKACRAFSLADSTLKPVGGALKGEGSAITPQANLTQLASVDAPKINILIKSGELLYAGVAGRIAAIRFDLKSNRALAEWSAPIEGNPVYLIAGDDRLVVVTREGRIYCFGGDFIDLVVHKHEPETPPRDGRAADLIHKMLLDHPVSGGYAVVWGIGNGRLPIELARQSKLHTIVVEPLVKKAEAYRQELLNHDLYGHRISVDVGDRFEFPLPPYMAELMLVEEMPEIAPAAIGRIFQSLRPYGGKAFFHLPAARHAEFRLAAAQAVMSGAAIGETLGMMTLTRAGALPGAANWTHEHADAANTRVSKDTLVKAPLGILWFGGPTNDTILPRHGHGPQPQVIDGRMIIEGTNTLRATDIYTGRLLWEVILPGVGEFYDNVSHQPGANSAGTNFISASDGIYVAYKKAYLRFDPATGKKLDEFPLPELVPGKGLPRAGFISVVGDFLIAGADPLYEVSLDRIAPAKDADPKKKPTLTSLLSKIDVMNNDTLSASRHLVVMDRHTGQVVWTASAREGFRHNAIISGNGRVFAIDRMSGPGLARLKRRGEEPQNPPRLTAFDLATGKVLWASEEEVFGTWLSYSETNDILVESGRNARDTLSDEPRGMRAWSGRSGKPIWFEPTAIGPAMIHHETIIVEGSARDLFLGKVKMRSDPLTDELVPWTWTRTYGCNTPSGSENLLTFRSGAAGYFDLCGDGGTGNFGGFRSGCTNNLIVAGGVLTAPDYTRTCTCAYQNQTSLAFVNMPESEMWTYFGSGSTKGSIRRAGVNFGAPGDRRADNGTLWTEYPSSGGKSPLVDVAIVGPKVEYFRRHSSLVKGNVPGWICGSGVTGATSIRVSLGE